MTSGFSVIIDPVFSTENMTVIHNVIKLGELGKYHTLKKEIFLFRIMESNRSPRDAFILLPLEETIIKNFFTMLSKPGNWFPIYFLFLK